MENAGFLKESNFNGIKVLHVPQKKFKSTALRLLGFVYWHLVSFTTALFLKKPDIILSPSPPLTIGLLNIWLGKLRGRKRSFITSRKCTPIFLARNQALCSICLAVWNIIFIIIPMRLQPLTDIL